MIIVVNFPPFWCWKNSVPRLYSVTPYTDTTPVVCLTVDPLNLIYKRRTQIQSTRIVTPRGKCPTVDICSPSIYVSGNKVVVGIAS